MTSLPMAEPPPVKFHLSLNVTDLGRSLEFYRALFGAEPAKHHPDYAKFELDDPPLVFSLVPRAPGAGGNLSHLGFRAPSTEAVHLAGERLAAAGVCVQDQNGTVCGYARQDKVWVKDPDGNFWEIYAVEEEVAPALVRRSLEGPAARVEAASGPVVWEHCLTHPEAVSPHAPESVDEVRLTGTFNADLDESGRSRVLVEAFTVLRPGGKLVAHALLADRPLPGAAPKLPGLAAMVARAPARAEVEAYLLAVGFVHVHSVKLTDRPWFVHEDVGLREVKLVAFKAPADTGQTKQVLYKGPFAEAKADGGWAFLRGRRVTVPAAVWQGLRLGPAAEQFLFFEPGEPGGCSMA
jgi:catechol 2,3-dioxygenase-like lactoylglutathione lyase family enzyme